MKKAVTVMFIACLCICTIGCATMRQNGAVIGGLVGAGAGAVAARYHPLLGAAVGGLVGTVVGTVAGSYADEVKRGREGVVHEISYRPYMGSLVQIREVNVMPTVIQPGGSVRLGVNYCVVCPAPHMTMKITECREILFDNRPVMQPLLREVVRTQGLITSTLTLPVPQDAREGTYTVVTTVYNTASCGKCLSRFFVRK